MKENKFLAIYNEIVQAIEEGTYKRNTKLPSENELVASYGTSRETIRKALTLLAQNGYIQKVKGKGSFVLDMKRFDFPVSGLTSFKEVTEKMGKASTTIVYEVSTIYPDEYLQQHLQVTKKDSIWKVYRSRKIDGEKIIFDKDYFHQKYIPYLSKEICEHSIYDYIEQELNLKISFAKKEILVEEATKEDQIYLDLKEYPYVVVVKNFVYLDDASLFQYTESRHRLDKFRFVDFARRAR
ncbi:trehalose operon repressor [Priestia koreensis]|uniref:Trehalose operon repressor n=1 Tax=Priestia koreensis TaxID=284581 RepID=A0A0M0LPA3_9BACI|nr:trehalose operon repressor [Priestia koreensis]KOO52727.1 transcriptional regulator [Priestia koreensis]